MTEENTEYKKTFKNTLAFGGVQVFNILISLIRGKCIAVLLGPTGMGINSLLNTSISLISTLSGLGLELAAVRELSESNIDEDPGQFPKTVSIINKLFFYTGILGGVITIVLSPFLSKWSFDNYDYTWSFVFLSFVLFFTAISRGQGAILRGLRRVDFIIKSGLYASVIGLVTSIPLFYFFGNQGIVPSLIITAATTLIISNFYLKKLGLNTVFVAQKEVISEGITMAKLGMMLIIATLLGNLTRFGINIFIGKFGDIGDIGLYAAAIAISGQYIGFVLTSLSADYFPRLAAVTKDQEKMNLVVNEQIQIVLLLASPLLILMLIMAPVMIHIMLSSEFLVITDFIRFVALGSFFQAVSFCLGYISFAKNDKKTYFLVEGLLSNILQFGLTIAFYYVWGIKGLGYAFLATYLIYFVLLFYTTKLKYSYKMSGTVAALFFKMLLLISLCFGVFLILDATMAYVIGAVLFILSLLFSYRELNRVIPVKAFISGKLNRKK